MTTEVRKYKLIEGIMNVSDEATLSSLESLFQAFMEDRASIQHLVKPMRERLDIDKLVKEQHYEGADKEVIDNLIDEMEIEEPIEKLLEML